MRRGFSFAPFFVTFFIMVTGLKAHSQREPTPNPDCVARENLHFICGLKSPEDVVNLAGTRWLVASGRADANGPGQLHIIDAKTKRWHFAYPSSGANVFDIKNFSSCPGAPDPKTFTTNGLALRSVGYHHYRLYAANHGGREAIEFFDIAFVRDGPRITWVGCVVMPEHTNPNALAPLPEGGLVVASMNDPGDPDKWPHLMAGDSVGSVWRWTPKEGFARFKNVVLSGGNGVETTGDGQWIYVSAWASGKLLRFKNFLEAAAQEIGLDFLPDNLRWAPNGNLLVTGQRRPVRRIAACTGNPCPDDWVVSRLDTATMKVHEVIARPGNDTVNYAAGALLYGDTLFITVRGDLRIAYVNHARALF